MAFTSFILQLGIQNNNDNKTQMQYDRATLYRMESQTQKMSTMTGFSSSGSRWSGIPCQKWSKKFWIWKKLEQLGYFNQFDFVWSRILDLFGILIITSSKLTLMALSRMHWQCVLYIMINVSTWKKHTTKPAKAASKCQTFTFEV